MLQDFIDAYLDCMFWAEQAYDESGEILGPMEDFASPDDLSPEGLKEIEQDCTCFFDKNRYLWQDSASDEQTGHDFYLTRNGHGAGFWDRPEVYGKENAGMLTDACRPYGTQGLMWCGEGHPVEVHG
jgi:hypothetical protein